MENLTITALEQILTGPTASAVAVLSMIALISVSYKLLSSKDRFLAYKDKVIAEQAETIKILRKERKDDTETMFDFITKLSIHLEKLSSLYERHDTGAHQSREKILGGIDKVLEKFISLPCKYKGQ